MTAQVNDHGHWYLRCDLGFETAGNERTADALNPTALGWTALPAGQHRCPKTDRLHRGEASA